jgi:hypothetical protein
LKHSNSWTLCVVAAAVAVVGATQAQADVMEFENPEGDGHFVWYAPGASGSIGLEVISDAASQTGAVDGVGQFHQVDRLPSNDFVGAPPGGQLEVGGDADYFLVGLDTGAEIPSGAPWREFGLIYHPDAPSPHTWLPDEPTYLGIQFPMGGETHYGWIYVDKFIGEGGEHCLDALAWAYETTPDTPIVTPEPGSLALLVFGAAMFRRRRNRA